MTVDADDLLVVEVESDNEIYSTLYELLDEMEELQKKRERLYITFERIAKLTGVNIDSEYILGLGNYYVVKEALKAQEADHGS